MKLVGFSNILQKLDFFGAQVNLTINGQRKFKTKLGGFLSFIFALTSLFYGGFSAVILVMKLNTSFNQNTITNYYSQSDAINSIERKMDAQGKVTEKAGFNLAFGIFNDDLNTVPNFDQYFKLRVSNYSFVSS